MDKTKNLDWFVELMKNKMMKHEDEDPLEMWWKDLVEWLECEVKELKKAIQFETTDEIILECADVANMAYFIASWMKEKQRGR